MDLSGTTWFNVERGVCLAFAALVVYAGSAYLTSRPRPASELLDPARAPLGENDIVTAGKTRDRTTLDLSGRNIFVLPHLTRMRIRKIPDRPVKPPPPPPPNKDKPEVNLPQKPSAKPPPPPPDPDDPDPDPSPPDEEPFPLTVLGIVRIDDNASERRVIVAGLADPGTPFTLAVEDEWKSLKGEIVKVTAITRTSVTFLRDNGRVHKKNLDPLKDWKPLLRDENGGDRPAPGPADPFDLVAPPDPGEKTPDAPPAPLPRLPDIKGPADLRRLMKDLEKKNPDLLRNLEKKNPELYRMLKNVDPKTLKTLLGR